VECTFVQGCVSVTNNDPSWFPMRQSVLLFLEEMIKNTWPSLMCPDSFWKFFISHLSFHTAFHCYPALLFLFPQSSASYPIMTFSSSKSGSVKQLSDNPQPHVFEIFHFSEDYEAFRRQVILPTICGSHDHQYI
jgi:hypothetical protein